MVSLLLVACKQESGDGRPPALDDQLQEPGVHEPAMHVCNTARGSRHGAHITVQAVDDVCAEGMALLHSGSVPSSN